MSAADRRRLAELLIAYAVDVSQVDAAAANLLHRIAVSIGRVR